MSKKHLANFRNPQSVLSSAVTALHKRLNYWRHFSHIDATILGDGKTAPICERLIEAGLANQDRINTALVNWRRTGISFSRCLLQATEVQPETLCVLDDLGQTARQRGSEEVVDYLVAAALIGTEDLAQAELKRQHYPENLDTADVLVSIEAVSAETVAYFRKNIAKNNDKIVSPEKIANAAKAQPPPKVEKTEASSVENEPSPQPSTSSTSTPRTPLLLVNEAFLRLHDYEIVVDVNAPIFKRLQGADLIEPELLSLVQTRWKREGGLLANILQTETGLKATTLNFFSDWSWKYHLNQQKRIGEYLRDAHLVTEEDVQLTLEDLKRRKRGLMLGTALAERGLIRQTTADYFASNLVDVSGRPLARGSKGKRELVALKNVEVATTPSGHPLSIVNLRGRVDCSSAREIRNNLFQAAESFSPNILLDMTLVTNLDIGGLGAIVSAANMCRVWRGQLCVCGASKETLDVMQRFGMGRVLRPFLNREEAIAYFPIG